MKTITLKYFSFFILILVLSISVVHAKTKESGEKIKVSLQKRIPSDLEEGAFVMVNDIQEWKSTETAIIICDMWDHHWCKGASDRVEEMAPFMNKVVSVARGKGILIVHAPSDCMDYYKDYPERNLVGKYENKKAKSLISDNKLDSEKDAIWPIDQSDGGCDCSPECTLAQPWTKQTDLIDISDKDAISDSGIEIAGLFQNKGIKNVILMGVHTNMCVIGRSFGLRNMVRLGMNVALMRDLTDTMYDSKQWPNVLHFTGNSLVTEYIETYVCATMVSCDFTGQKQFRFKNDNRPLVAFVTAEGEYRANQTLPEFAHELLLSKNVNCEFALGKPIMEGTGRHNIENLQILNDADLAVFFVRRRALEPEKMALIKRYVYSGKPVLGIRTASHSFDTKGKVPRESEGNVAAKGELSEFLESWPEFDEVVLGGNYQNHYGHLKEETKVSIVPGMENHSLLRGINPGGFSSPGWLYINKPLRSDNIQVLLLGTISGQESEPVFWINQNKYGKAVYTSLGHWDDWKIESFKKAMLNSVDYLLHTKTE